MYISATHSPPATLCWMMQFSCDLAKDRQCFWYDDSTYREIGCSAAKQRWAGCGGGWQRRQLWRRHRSCRWYNIFAFNSCAAIEIIRCWWWRRCRGRGQSIVRWGSFAAIIEIALWDCARRVAQCGSCLWFTQINDHQIGAITTRCPFGCRWGWGCRCACYSCCCCRRFQFFCIHCGHGNGWLVGAFSCAQCGCDNNRGSGGSDGGSSGSGTRVNCVAGGVGDYRWSCHRSESCTTDAALSLIFFKHL